MEKTASKAWDKVLNVRKAVKVNGRGVRNEQTKRIRTLPELLNATNKQNREAALSAIQDTDIAKASADLSKSKIFIEAGTALLAMQNVNSKSVLRLLE
jgi:flagellin